MGLLLYPDGGIYYGQHEQLARMGIGKLIEFNGSFQEGTWEGDKLTGSSCRVFDVDSGDLYSGPIVDGKRTGQGRLFDAVADEVYEGDFENN